VVGINSVNPLAQAHSATEISCTCVAPVNIIIPQEHYHFFPDLDHSVIRGVADANALIAQGANCSISTNNVMNPFTPYGDCSLVRIANLYANVVQRGTEEDLSECFAMLTNRPARILRRNDYGIAVGNPADLVVWNATTPAESMSHTAFRVIDRRYPERSHRSLSGAEPS